MADLEKEREGSDPNKNDGKDGDNGDRDTVEDSKEQASSKVEPSVQVAESGFRATPLLIGALCLGIGSGLGIGYVGHAFQVNKAKKEADAAVKGKGDDATGPCKDWAESICGRMGERAYECTHARVASTLLSGSACMQAQESVPAKLDAIKAERVRCDELTSKLCSDLGPEGKGCELVMAKEPTFSLEDCQDMTKNYKRVLAEITERQEKGTLPPPPGKPRNVTIAKPN